MTATVYYGTEAERREADLIPERDTVTVADGEVYIGDGETALRNLNPADRDQLRRAVLNLTTAVRE